MTIFCPLNIFYSSNITKLNYLDAKMDHFTQSEREYKLISESYHMQFIRMYEEGAWLPKLQ